MNNPFISGERNSVRVRDMEIVAIVSTYLTESVVGVNWYRGIHSSLLANEWKEDPCGNNIRIPYKHLIR